MLEVLHRIGDVGLAPGHAGRRQGLIKHLTCRPDKGTTRQVFLIPWLFADDHQPGLQWTFTGHPLSRIAPQWAAAARIHTGCDLLKA